MQPQLLSQGCFTGVSATDCGQKPAPCRALSNFTGNLPLTQLKNAGATQVAGLSNGARASLWKNPAPA
jgi:hypothetical protein